MSMRNNLIVQSATECLFNGKTISMMSGQNGFCLPQDKIEGDMKTPMIALKPLALYYRADRVPKIQTALPSHIITPNAGWCDAPNDVLYNQFVTLPYAASAEQLWREDHCYDYFLVTDYNYPQAKPFCGSAIFIHVKHDNHRPTAGCLAFNISDLVDIISVLSIDDFFIFKNNLTNAVYT